MDYVNPGCRCHYVSPLPWAMVSLASPSSFAPRQSSSKLDFALGLASVGLSGRCLAAQIRPFLTRPNDRAIMLRPFRTCLVAQNVPGRRLAAQYLYNNQPPKFNIRHFPAAITFFAQNRPFWQKNTQKREELDTVFEELDTLHR